jgi:hypothetical protein
VYGARWCNSHLAGPADSRVAVDLDEDLSFQDREDLVGAVVAMEVSDVVGSDGLHSYDEALQPLLGSGDHADVTGPGRKRHPT